MNRELEKAEGDILLIANSDARLMTTLVPMLEILDKDSNAIVGPKIVDEEGIIQDRVRTNEDKHYHCHL